MADTATGGPLDIAVTLPILGVQAAYVIAQGIAALPAIALAVYRVEKVIYEGRNDRPY